MTISQEAVGVIFSFDQPPIAVLVQPACNNLDLKGSCADFGFLKPQVAPWNLNCLK